MASSSSSPPNAASGDAAAMPESSVVVPPEGLVIPRSAVVEATGGDHNPAALELLEEEYDTHNGDWRGSDIMDRDIKELIVEGYLPTMDGLAWRAAPAGKVTPSPQARERCTSKPNWYAASPCPSPISS